MRSGAEKLWCQLTSVLMTMKQTGNGKRNAVISGQIFGQTTKIGPIIHTIAYSLRPHTLYQVMWIYRLPRNLFAIFLCAPIHCRYIVWPHGWLHGCVRWTHTVTELNSKDMDKTVRSTDYTPPMLVQAVNRHIADYLCPLVRRLSAFTSHNFSPY